MDSNLKISKNESTVVDLGNDLLSEPTRVLGVPLPCSATPPPAPSSRSSLSFRQSGTEAVSDQIESAKILQQEGLFDDAKKILRKILLAEPNRWEVKEILDEIQNVEIKQLLSDSGYSPQKRRNTDILLDTNIVSTEIMLRRLELDLKLSTTSCVDEEPLKFQWTHASARDSLDLGTAFFEMGLFKTARKVLETAHKDEQERLGALSLIAQCWINEHKPYEVTHLLEPVLAEAETTREEKLDLIYWMARAFEQMQYDDLAIQWYEEVIELNPDYRDSVERLKWFLQRQSARILHDRTRKD